MNELLNRTKGDKIIWAVVIMLSFIGVLAVYSSASFLAFHENKSVGSYLMKHVMILIIGFFIIYFVHRVNYTIFAKAAVFAYLVSLPLLVITLFTMKQHEAARRITVPLIGLTFQTSDFAKLALFMFLARSMSISQGVIRNFKEIFLPVIFPMLLTCLLIAPANLSTALMLAATCAIVFFIGRVRVRHLLYVVGTCVAILAFVVLLSKMGIHIARVDTWIHRTETYMGASGTGDAQKDGYQVLQAKIAVANGGFWGLGPGRSTQRNFLPHADSDFIYAIILEEYGLIGGFLLIIFYLLFLWRSILIFRRCPYAFGAFLAMALSIALVFQAMLNMAVNVHLLPVTGITLPMVSMGGTSILFTSVAIGIVLSVSKYVDEMEGGRNGGPARKSAKKVADDKEPDGSATGGSKIFIKTGKGQAGLAPSA